MGHHAPELREGKAAIDTSGRAENPVRPAHAERVIVTMMPSAALQVRSRGLEVSMSYADRGSRHFQVIDADAKTLGYKLHEIDYAGTHASVRYVELTNKTKRYSASVPLDHQNNARPGILSEMQARRNAEGV